MSTTESTEDRARSLALDALARGWLDGSALWNAAARFARLGPNATASDVFAGSLSAAQIDTLSRRRDAESETIGPPLATRNTARGVTRVDGAMAGDAAAPITSTRYELGVELGRGGMGSVLAARDRKTERTVALKTLHESARDDHDTTQRFLREARITAQLEHPAVIPVYDIGLLPDGAAFYTMRIVERRSLRHVLDQPAPRKDWPLARLCAVFVQVCRAVGYAHSRGVVHRDLKPENILLGEHGEVYVADWGIAKRLDEGAHRDTAIFESRSRDLSASASPLHGHAEEPGVRLGTIDGSVLGTPGYMAPEQALGRTSDQDARSDVFALGAILYELLTGRVAIEGSSLGEVLAATLDPRPARPREVAPACPLLLEELCLRMLSANRDDRPSTADEVADGVESYLEGAKEKDRRRQEAVRLADVAKGHVVRYESLARESESLADAARAKLRDVKPWDDLARKRPGWALEDDALRAEVDQARALAATLEAYSQALGYDPESTAARGGLAELYFGRFVAAEQRHDVAGLEYNASLVGLYDNGRFTSRLSAPATVSLATPRAPAEVVAYRYREIDRVLQPVEPRVLGTTPLHRVTLEAGSWLLVLKSGGFREVRYPVRCARGEHHEGIVDLFTDAEVGAGFEYVPGGAFRMGGDREAYDALAAQSFPVANFAMATHAVTFREYLEFVADLERIDPSSVMRRVPRVTDASEGMVAIRNEQGVWTPRWELIVEGEGRKFCPADRVMDIAVCCVDWFDAVAYAAWRSARDGVEYRLPTEAEWEKSARGIDGRSFPWGDRFDATFCKMRDSRPGFGQPEAVGAFATDVSVYGVHDLAGSMRCWVADVFGVTSADDARREVEPPMGAPRDAAGMRMARGGAWNFVPSWCRAASRPIVFALSRHANTGIRLVKSLR